MSRNAQLITAAIFCYCCLWCLGARDALAQPPGTRGAFSRPDQLFARVILVEDDRATRAFKVQPDRVAGMLEAGLTNLTGQPTAAAAWRTLVSSQDVVGLKVYSIAGPVIGTRPAVVAAALEGLLAAGLSPSNLVIWDRKLEHLQAAGFVDLARRYGVRVAASQAEGWDERKYYESPLLGQLVAGDLEFQKTGDGVGRKSFVTRLVTRQLTRIINISPLLNHYSTGVAGNLYSLAAGSVDNFLRFENDTGRLTQAIPELVALPELGDRVALNIVDALICQYEGEHELHLHYAVALNQLRLSADPVALDVLSLEELSELRRQRNVTALGPTNVVNIYRNASVLQIGVGDPSHIYVERLRRN